MQLTLSVLIIDANDFHIVGNKLISVALVWYIASIGNGHLCTIHINPCVREDLPFAIPITRLRESSAIQCFIVALFCRLEFCTTRTVVGLLDVQNFGLPVFLCASILCTLRIDQRSDLNTLGACNTIQRCCNTKFILAACCASQAGVCDPVFNLQRRHIVQIFRANRNDVQHITDLNLRRARLLTGEGDGGLLSNCCRDLLIEVHISFGCRNA